MNFIAIALIIGIALGSLGILGIIQRMHEEREDRLQESMDELRREYQMTNYLESA